MLGRRKDQRLIENMSSAREGLPLVAMLVVEFAQIGLATLSKAAMRNGLNQYVFIVYYDALGTVILLPWFIRRYLSGKRLPITSSLLCRFFGLSLIGKCLFPICFYTGLNYSSITIGAAIGNLSPIFTFLLAVSLRMEKIDLRKLTDRIKVSGTIVAVLGALIVTLYQGPALLASQGSSNSAPHDHPLLPEQSNWPLGCLIFTLGFLLRSLWSILQAETAKAYPDEVAIVFFYTLFGTIQTAAAALYFVQEPSAWKLQHKIDFISVLYAGFSISVFTITVTTWCLHKKGPIYVSMFSPLQVALAGVMGFVFLQDGIYLGSVIGSATIVVGFYAVLLAQAKKKTDMVSKCNVGGLESASSQVTPLLRSSHS